MHASKEVQEVEKKVLRATKLPEYRSGDTVRVHAKIKEGSGKERIQMVEGVIIRKSGKGATKTFTLRKMSDGIGVELIYPEDSGNVAHLEVLSRGDVRRARLYYLRGLTGKASRLKSKDGFNEKTLAATPAPKAIKGEHVEKAAKKK